MLFLYKTQFHIIDRYLLLQINNIKTLKNNRTFEDDNLKIIKNGVTNCRVSNGIELIQNKNNILVGIYTMVDAP